MAATPAVASSMQTLNWARSKILPSEPLVRLTPFRTPAFSTSLSHSYTLEPLVLTCSSHRLPVVLRVSSTDVAQEEAVKEEQQEGEEVVVEEGESQEQSEGESLGESGVNTKLYFGNLPYSVDSAQLAGIIQAYGSPELIEVLYDRQTGKSRGFAFVTMSSIEDCNAVIENLDGSQYLGRILRVNFSDKPKPKEPLYPETEFKLFVGNLSWSVTSESLTEAFQEHGNVVGSRVLYDGETGRSRGYGFVCYSTKEEMEIALQNLNGMVLDGRPIRVSLAQGKKR